MDDSKNTKAQIDRRVDGHTPLQWNRGAWLGSQLGGSCWILLAGLLSLPKHQPAALGAIALFGIANIAGWLLWRRREKLSAYAGIQILLPVLGLCGLGTVYLLNRTRVYDAIQYGGSISADGTYLMLLLAVPMLMLVFYLRFGRYRNGRLDGIDRSSPPGGG